MPAQPAQHQAHELRVAPSPAVLYVEVRDRAIDVREANPDKGAVLVLALVHDEDPVRPEQEVAGHGHGGKGRHPRRADLVTWILHVEVLGRPAPVDVGGADEEDAFASGHSLPIVRGPDGTLTPAQHSG